MKQLFTIVFVCYAFAIATSYTNDNHGVFDHKSDKITQTVVDFTLKDTLGKPVSLHEFIGKFVVISMGAGWCGPCMGEVEPTKKLQQYFANRDDIVWVFVNFDKDSGSWAITRKTEKIKGLHLWGRPAKEDLKKLFNFNKLPYYIYIDKDGKVVQNDAPRPSERAARKDIETYLR